MKAKEEKEAQLKLNEEADKIFLLESNEKQDKDETQENIEEGEVKGGIEENKGKFLLKFKYLNLK